MLDIRQSDSECILLRHKQLIGQINDVLCTFGMLDPVIKTELSYTYCSSLYGSVLWNLQHPDIDRISALLGDQLCKESGDSRTTLIQILLRL
jgi:hypothetical protein